MMIIAMFPAAYALNASNGYKAVNCLGYEVNRNSSTGAIESISVFFDKSFNDNAIKLLKSSTNTEVSVTVSAGTGGAGWTQTNSPNGYEAVLTPISPEVIANTTEYTVVVSGTLVANNGQNLGHYLNHSDVFFNIYTPDISGTYGTHIPQYTYLPSAGSSNIGEGTNVSIICDVPFDVVSSTLVNNVSTYVYLANATGTKIDGDPSFTAHAASTNYCGYVTQINDEHTCIFIPMTIGKSTTAVYNLANNTTYRLAVPTYINSSGYIQFSTGAQTSSNFCSNEVDYTGYSTGTITLVWDNIDSADNGSIPTYYRVYWSDNEYFGYTEAGITDNIIGNTGSQSAIDVFIYNASSLSGETKYFPVTPVYGSNEGGFSLPLEYTFS